MERAGDDLGGGILRGGDLTFGAASEGAAAAPTAGETVGAPAVAEAEEAVVGATAETAGADEVVGAAAAAGTEGEEGAAAALFAHALLTALLPVALLAAPLGATAYGLLTLVVLLVVGAALLVGGIVGLGVADANEDAPKLTFRVGDAAADDAPDGPTLLGLRDDAVGLGMRFGATGSGAAARGTPSGPTAAAASGEKVPEGCVRTGTLTGGLGTAGGALPLPLPLRRGDGDAAAEAAPTSPAGLLMPLLGVAEAK